MDKYKPLVGMKKDCGILQIFFQSTDTNKNYSTALNGEYNLKLLDLKVITSGAAGQEYFVQMSSSTIRNDKANLNDNFKFHHLNGQNTIPNPIMFYDCVVKNWIDISFSQLGSVGTDINTTTYNILLTFEYERL
jgi:hypothetical protein